jgi:hypothetical protein
MPRFHGVGNGADAVPAHPPRAPNSWQAGERRRQAPRSGRWSTLLVESRDRPAARPMKVGQRKTSAGCLNLEHRPGSCDHRERSGLLADGRQPRHGQALLAPGDLSWASIQPARPHADLDRLHSNHRHEHGSFRRHSLCSVRRRGTAATERLFGSGDTLDRTGVRCQEVDGQSISSRRVTLAVTVRRPPTIPRRRSAFRPRQRASPWANGPPRPSSDRARTVPAAATRRDALE